MSPRDRRLTGMERMGLKRADAIKIDDVVQREAEKAVRGALDAVAKSLPVCLLGIGLPDTLCAIGGIVLDEREILAAKARTELN